MKKLLSLILYTQLSSVFAANSILAIVNDNIITIASIEQELSAVEQYDEKMVIIDKKINNYLMLDKIVELGISPTQESIDSAIENLAQKNNISIYQFKSHPEFPVFLEDIINQLAISELQQIVIRGITITLTDEEIKSTCQNDTNKKDLRQIMAAQIIISAVEGAENQELATKEFLTKLTIHIEKGASFISLAKLHSQDSSYAQGGLTEWINADDKYIAFIDNLKEGEVSEIYKSGSGWAIAIKADERYIDSSVEACKQQIINKKTIEYYIDWVQKLRDSAYIEIFSDKI